MLDVISIFLTQDSLGLMEQTEMSDHQECRDHWDLMGGRVYQAPLDLRGLMALSEAKAHKEKRATLVCIM